MNKNIILLLLTSLISTLSFAHKYTGRVADANNYPLPDALVVNERSGDQTITDVNGVFTLDNVVTGDSISVKLLGYSIESFAVGEDLHQEVAIKLQDGVLELEAVTLQSETSAENLLTRLDLRTTPVRSAQDLLRKVPGLVIGQHAGGGKAEQIFLRGFDIDHGTDISINVDGLPVNMVSHAHGQGYADLHFLIPESVEKINFEKGSYDASQGNFATAGAVGFKTKDRLDHSFIKLEGGQFNTGRINAGVNIINTESNSLYAIGEYVRTDGYFNSSQDFNRLNLMTKYTGFLNDKTRLSALVSHFQSTWDASGQIPVRAVESGQIDRFGAIDDTEGGETGRTNFSVSLDKYISDNKSIKNQLYASLYDFDLFSNFTFFLVDSINGDQIRQSERRQLIGGKSEFQTENNLGNAKQVSLIGVGFRYDRSIDNQLSRTRSRTEILERIQFGDINEANFFAFGKTSLLYKKWDFNIGLRVDNFLFRYEDFLVEEDPISTASETKLTPKFNVQYNYSDKLEVFFKSGIGFHSNDTRVVVENSQEEILPSAYSSDLGLVWKPSNNFILNTAIWGLFLEQEFVYVGDAGIVEPSGRTRRVGADLSIRYQFKKYFFLSFDANYAHARSIDEENGEDFIPLAPNFSGAGGVNMILPNGIYANIQYRALTNRPANEDNSITAEGYFVTDFTIGKEWKQFDFSLQIQNLLNTEWNETQFATESRLRDEQSPVEEIHFTPGTPFFAQVAIKYSFK